MTCEDASCHQRLDLGRCVSATPKQSTRPCPRHMYSHPYPKVQCRTSLNQRYHRIDLPHLTLCKVILLLPVSVPTSYPSSPQSTLIPLWSWLPLLLSPSSDSAVRPLVSIATQRRSTLRCAPTTQDLGTLAPSRRAATTTARSTTHTHTNAHAHRARARARVEQASNHGVFRAHRGRLHPRGTPGLLPAPRQARRQAQVHGQIQGGLGENTGMAAQTSASRDGVYKTSRPPRRRHSKRARVRGPQPAN